MQKEVIKIIWSTGEASPKNCKAPYPFAMAEKRLKDRLVLKLINAYEYGIYSDSEADNFQETMIETNITEIATLYYDKHIFWNCFSYGYQYIFKIN